jgi:hypothetical protein
MVTLQGSINVSLADWGGSWESQEEEDLHQRKNRWIRQSGKPWTNLLLILSAFLRLVEI